MLDGGGDFEITTEIVEGSPKHVILEEAERWGAATDANNRGTTAPSLDNAVLNLIARGVTFVAAAGNDGQDASNISPARRRRDRGFLSGPGAQNSRPSKWFQTSYARYHNGWLCGPADANFDLYLFKWDRDWASYSYKWTIVARSENGGSTEQISCWGAPGLLLVGGLLAERKRELQFLAATPAVTTHSQVV